MLHVRNKTLGSQLNIILPHSLAHWDSERSQTEPNRTMPNWTEPYQTEPYWTELYRTEPNESVYLTNRYSYKCGDGGYSDCFIPLSTSTLLRMCVCGVWECMWCVCGVCERVCGVYNDCIMNTPVSITTFMTLNHMKCKENTFRPCDPSATKSIASTISSWWCCIFNKNRPGTSYLPLHTG